MRANIIRPSKTIIISGIEFDIIKKIKYAILDIKKIIPDKYFSIYLLHLLKIELKLPSIAETESKKGLEQLIIF